MLHSTTIQYAFTIISDLKAAVGSETLTRSKDIADNHSISMMFVDQILRKLRNAGIVRSHRGPGGGFELIKMDVTALDVYQALNNTGPRAFKLVLKGANHTINRINEALASVTL